MTTGTSTSDGAEQLLGVDDDDEIEVEVTEYHPVPQGLYEVELINAERIQTKFGDGVKLIYRVVGGPEADSTVDELCSLRGGHKAKLRERLGALRGRPFQSGELLRPRELFGAHAQAYVTTQDVPGENGVPFTVNRIRDLSPMGGGQNGGAR